MQRTVALLLSLACCTHAAFLPPVAPTQRTALKVGEAAARSIKKQHDKKRAAEKERQLLRSSRSLFGALGLALAGGRGLITRVWRLLPGKLPAFWRASGLTTDRLGQTVRGDLCRDASS